MPSMTISTRPLQLRRLGTFLAVLCLGGAAFAQTAHFSGIVNTAGSGFSYPQGMAVDASGDVFVAGSQDSAVKEIVAVNGKVSSSSTVITVGSGFSQPFGVAVDASGDVFVADIGNNAVKEIVAVNGQVSSSSTVIPVGSGFSRPWSVAVDASGDVFVADRLENAVKEIVAVNGKVSSSSTVKTVGIGFNSLTGVAVDASGDVFVADWGNNAVKEIVAVNGQVSSTSTVITVGSGFSVPWGVAVDASGDVFIVDDYGKMKEILAVNGQVSSTSTVITVGNGVIAAENVAVGASGNVFVSTYPSEVKEIDLAAANFGTVNVGSASATTLIPFTFDSAGTPSGWKVFTQGATGLDFTEVTGSTTCSTATDYAVGDICSVAVRFSPRHPGLRMGAVQLMDSSGKVTATAHLRGIGSGPQVVFPSNDTPYAVGGGFFSVGGVAVDASGDVFVADFNGAYDQSKVKEIVAVNGQVSSTSTVITVASGIFQPYGLAVDGSGDVFVADYWHNAVKEVVAVNGKVSSSSTVSQVGGLFAGPVGLAVDASGDVFVGDDRNNAVYEIVAVNGQVSSSSTVITVGSGFLWPDGLAVDASGNVFVGDQGHNAVKEIVAVNGQVSSSSTVITLGSGFWRPYGVAVDASGDVFVADSSNGVVKEIVAVNGHVSSTSTVITLGSVGNYPTSVAVDASGNVFLAAAFGGAPLFVSEMPLATPPSLSFATTAVGSTSSDSPRTVQIQNDGNADLTFTGLSYPTDFPSAGSGTNPCNGTTVLSAGGECDLEIDFSPLSPGTPLSEHVTLTDNALNVTGAQQSVPVSGTAGSPTPASITSPTPGSTFTGSVEAFVWTAGIGVTTYELRIGTGVGLNDIYDSGSTTAMSVSVNNIPTNSAKVYVQLLSSFNGSPTQIANYTFMEATPVPAALISPTPGSTLGGFSQTFTWTSGSFATKYELRIGTTGIGSSNVYSGATTGTSVTVGNIPAAGATVYVALLSYFNGAPTKTANYTFTEATAKPAALTFPTASTLSGSSVTFTWSSGNLVSDYELWVGTTNPSSSNVYRSGWLTATSATVNNIPTSGGTVYVRLCSLINGVWQFKDYTFIESGGPPTPAVLTSPTGTTLTGSSQTFTWSAGVGVTKYSFRVGTTGVGSKNIFNSYTTLATSATVNNIPTNGGTVYVGVSSEINGVWQFTGYTFLESGGPPTPATLTAPTGTTLAGSSQTFTWTVGAGVADYELWVGTTNASSSNVYRSGWLTATSATVNNIPTSGGRVFVRLCSMINGTWQFTDYTFTESGGPPVKAALTSPTVTTLTGSSQTFTWSAGVGVSKYELRVGTTGYGSRDIYNSGSTTATSALVNNIPTNGGTVYVGVSSQINGVWHYAAYTFNAQ